MSEYFDTRCIIKWFKEDEEYHEESLELRERILWFETEFVMSWAPRVDQGFSKEYVSKGEN